jgi:hypothetical protein
VPPWQSAARNGRLTASDAREEPRPTNAKPARQAPARVRTRPQSPQSRASIPHRTPAKLSSQPCAHPTAFKNDQSPKFSANCRKRTFEQSLIRAFESAAPLWCRSFAVPTSCRPLLCGSRLQPRHNPDRLRSQPLGGSLAELSVSNRPGGIAPGRPKLPIAAMNLAVNHTSGILSPYP